jgi:uncharacterized protein YjbJ (UPF0337 family)
MAGMMIADMHAEIIIKISTYSYVFIEELAMNWDIIEGNWKQYKGAVKHQWGKLTDDHLDQIAGKRDQLVGRIQESYGLTRDEADKQIDAFEERSRTNTWPL